MARLRMGYITESVRHRIVQEVASYTVIFNCYRKMPLFRLPKYCRYPSTRQYNVVSAESVDAYGMRWHRICEY